MFSTFGVKPGKASCLPVLEVYLDLWLHHQLSAVKINSLQGWIHAGTIISSQSFSKIKVMSDFIPEI